MSDALPDLSEPATVLVVDDEAAVAAQLTEGLEAAGFRALACHSATEALELIRAMPEIIVVMSDIRMPGGDGLQLARDILAMRGEEHAVEIIVITGHATVEDAASAVRSRVSDFLRKPFRLATAVSALRQAVARARERRAQHARQAQMTRHLLDGEARREELDRRLAALTERLAAMGEDGHAKVAMQDKLHAVSHALRTPLNAISASADLLQAGAGRAEPDYQRILQEGITEASRAVQLVEELIIAEGRMAGEARPSEAGALLRRVLERAGATRPGFRLEPPAEGQDMTVRAPRDMLTRALELTVEAALDWAPRGATLQSHLEVLGGDGREWACVTFVVIPAGATPPALPPLPVLPAQGSSLSRNMESLGYLVARRLLERQGGHLSSCVTGLGHGMLRLALPNSA
ncbi:MAG TPA: response regulator [Roseococcus sp.]|jgi:FixJ family two-component response regulator|nr:response regulator [Roseococcus sp.]